MPGVYKCSVRAGILVALIAGHEDCLGGIKMILCAWVSDGAFGPDMKGWGTLWEAWGAGFGPCL